LKIYRFKIVNRRDRNNWKILEVAGNMTLYNFAKRIVKVFNFDFDHCFCFTSNLKNPHQPADKLFELFADLDDVENTEGAFGVKGYSIDDAFEKVGDKMLFLFDYGDGWLFDIKCIDNSEEVIRTSRNFWKLIETHGENPEQYPNWD
jgi:hypothetical protein